jgi:hypothetical protein
MTRKKVTGMMIVRITGPDCRAGNRLYLPGETATVPAEVAEQWILTERAVIIAAEVEDGDGSHTS